MGHVCDTGSGLACEVSLVSPNAMVSVAVTGTGTTRTVAVDVGMTGYFLVKLWLIASATAPGVQASNNHPDGTDRVEWYEVTAADGTLSKTITHSSTGTWYMAAVLIGRVTVSDEIAFA